MHSASVCVRLSGCVHEVCDGVCTWCNVVIVCCVDCVHWMAVDSQLLGATIKC